MRFTSNLSNLSDRTRQRKLEVSRRRRPVEVRLENALAKLDAFEAMKIDDILDEDITEFVVR